MLRRVIGLCGLLWCFFVPQLEAAPAADGMCLAKKCGIDLVKCGIEAECRDWLQCVLSCGEDKVRCPSICGFSFQSPRINKTNLCIFESDCVALGFDSLGSYEHGTRPLHDLSPLEGRYWFAASHGGPQIFDLDCQSFDFVPSTEDPSQIAVHFQVPLQRHGHWSLRSARGTFTQQLDGSIEVSYENFVGYHERWYLIGQTADSLLAHVCIAGDDRCYDYGTLLLSRADFAKMPASDLTLFDEILRKYHGKSIWDFKQNQLAPCKSKER